MLKVAVFDTKQYDIAGFEKYGKENDINFKFFDTKLTEDTVGLARGSDAIVVFVNDTVNEKVINELCENGVKLIALRCAGFNNGFKSCTRQNNCCKSSGIFSIRGS